MELSVWRSRLQQGPLVLLCILCVVLQPNVVQAAEPPGLKQILETLGYQTVERGLPIAEKSTTEKPRVEIENPPRTSVRVSSTAVKALPQGWKEGASRSVEFQLEMQLSKDVPDDGSVSLPLQCYMQLYGADGQLMYNGPAKPVVKLYGRGVSSISNWVPLESPLRSGHAVYIVLCKPDNGETWQLLSYQTARITRLD
jgi:hypothetical protein